MKASKIRTLIIAICMLVPTTAFAYRWEFAPNEHMFHRECAPAMDYHAFMANQKHAYKIWKMSNDPRRMGIRLWLKTHREFLEKQKQERIDFQTGLSKNCVAHPWL